MDEQNAVNDVQVEVVEPQTEQQTDTSEVATETTESANVENAAEEVAKPRQDAETNAFYANARREKEAALAEKERIAAEKAEIEARYQQMQQHLKTIGYGDNVEIALEAQARNMTPEQVLEERRQLSIKQAEQEKVNQKISKLEEENALFKNQFAEEQYKKDLAEIKTQFPDEDAEDIKALGKTFMTLRANGVDNITAYKAIMDSRKKPTPPPVIGKVNDTSANEVSEYFSSEELDRITDEQYANPKIREKIMKSLRKLGK